MSFNHALLLDSFGHEQSQNIIDKCCRYPVDRVPLRTRHKASPTASDPAPGTGGSGFTTCPVAPNPPPGGEGSGIVMCPAVLDPPTSSGGL
jgi:hypothetical protein